jgi:hypothetical protein
LQPPDPGVDVARIDRVQRALRTEELHRETEPLFGSRQLSRRQVASFCFRDEVRRRECLELRRPWFCKA